MSKTMTEEARRYFEAVAVHAEEREERRRARRDQQHAAMPTRRGPAPQSA